MPIAVSIQKNEFEDESGESITQCKRKKLKKSNRPSTVLKNAKKEIEIVHCNDLNESLGTSTECMDSNEHINYDCHNFAENSTKVTFYQS